MVIQVIRPKMKYQIVHTSCADKTVTWAYITSVIRGKDEDDIMRRFRACHPYASVLSAVELSGVEA